MRAPSAGRATWHADKSPDVLRRWLSPRALLLHLILLIVAPGCLFAGWWQVHRALSGNLLSYGYSVEWPAFAIIAGIAWWQLIHDERGRGAREESAGASEGIAEPASSEAPDARPTAVRPDATVGGTPARPRRPWEPAPGTPEWEAFQADLESDLASRVPKTWGGRRAKAAHGQQR